MRRVATVRLSEDREARVYYGWQREFDGSVLTMRIEAVTQGDIAAGLTCDDQLALLDVVRKAIGKVNSPSRLRDYCAENADDWAAERLHT